MAVFTKEDEAADEDSLSADSVDTGLLVVQEARARRASPEISKQ